MLFLKKSNLKKITTLIIFTILGCFISLNVGLAADSIFDRALNKGLLPQTITEAYGQDKKIEITAFSGRVLLIINFLLTFMGLIFLALLLYAGYLWMIARGDEQQVTKAKSIAKEAVTGLIIILLSRLLTEFLLEEFGQATSVNPTS